MARLALCALALLVAGGLGSPPTKKTGPAPVVADKVLAERQTELMELFFQPNEVQAEEWKLEEHYGDFLNATAVKIYWSMLKNDWVVPRGAPFSISNYYQRYEVITLFHVLFSAKNYETLHHAALYLRNKVNESLFVYVLAVVILHHPETQGIVIPPIYEVFPTYFNNAEIVTTALKLDVHSLQHIHRYPTCYKWEENVVIRWNETVWPYYGHSTPVWYYTHDFGLNAFYYNLHLAYPSWLGNDVVPLWKDQRGEWTWFLHRQLLSRYYMELLSNGLGEIPELGHHIVGEGFNSGLLHPNGIPYPVRNNHHHLDQPVWANLVDEILSYENRIVDVLDKGYYVDVNGKNVAITAESTDVIWRLIDANVDSPNVHYYRDFISIWKKVLGNSNARKHYYNNFVPLEVPSVLETYQTNLRDPAFYMIWKRVLDIFWNWRQRQPLYTHEELSCPSVVIKEVQVDKLVTYFEHDYMNISALLYKNEPKGQAHHDNVSVLVEYPRLNHKNFAVRVRVNNAVAKKVVVRFFMAPKYDSHGQEIPLSVNTKHALLVDQFIYDLPQGETVIVRESTDNEGVSDDWEMAHKVYDKAHDAAHGKGEFLLKGSQHINKFPKRLVLPKGRVNGMPFVLLVHIGDYKPPSVLNQSSNPEVSYGFGTGVHRLTDDPLDFPLDRPLYPWMLKGLSNIVIQDVLIYHKHTPEIHVPHNE